LRWHRPESGRRSRLSSANRDADKAALIEDGVA
jgi:hypothetical protein